MSQQLNLLPPRRFVINPALVALIVWGVVLAVLLAVWGINQLRLVAAREAAAQAAQELKDARALIQQREQMKATLDDDIAALTPVADAAKQLINMAADLGTPAGYSAFFAMIASATEDGLWLTDIKLGKSGKTLEVIGQSLGNDAVMRYTGKLNGLLAEKELKLTTLEMSQQTIGATAASGGGLGVAGAPLSSTRFVLR